MLFKETIQVSWKNIYIFNQTKMGLQKRIIRERERGYFEDYAVYFNLNQLFSDWLFMWI